MPAAFNQATISSSCGLKSSGISGRCALYSGSAAVRSALNPPSHTTIISAGSNAARIFPSILTKP